MDNLINNSPVLVLLDCLYSKTDAVIFTNGEKTEQFPAFKTEVADTIGAGDAFFAFASLMSHLNWPEYDRLSIPSLAASITTTWLANEHHVTKDLLIQHAERNL